MAQSIDDSQKGCEPVGEFRQNHHLSNHLTPIDSPKQTEQSITCFHPSYQLSALKPALHSLLPLELAWLSRGVHLLFLEDFMVFFSVPYHPLPLPLPLPFRFDLPNRAEAAKTAAPLLR